jgi:LPXTG-site transpeptidase (sortase) family protein
MRKQHTKKSARARLRHLFIFIGIPLVAMCLTFVSLYVMLPVRADSTVLNKAITPPPVPIRISKVAAPVAGPPVRLQIPSIAIDTLINPVGLTSSGAMDIGENPDQVAWYQFGAIPGQIGSAVIAGHYGWGPDGHASVFNNLNMLKIGDTISVYDAAGVQTSFVVRDTRLYDPTADAAAVFTSDDGKAHLNLITCQGTWVSAKDSYSNRLVVFTDLVQK